ncbi:MAG: hypothetical protein JWP89_3704 [Schlesneria sp.]|nr:hypothetical protein [Schlesneria sp.]
MTYQTVVLSSFEEYLTTEYDDAEATLADYRGSEVQYRNEWLLRFPFAVMLKLSFAEMDYANRWCWQRFGSPRGECYDESSEYRTCMIDSSHCHDGAWAYLWHTKTEYNYGYCEWFFSSDPQHAQFLEFVPTINWGENFPK